MIKQGSMSIGRRRGTGGDGVRNNIPHTGPAQLLMLATDRDQPGVVKRATFNFPGWDEGSETFDTLAMIAEIVQDACTDVEEVRQRDEGRRSPHRKRSAGDRHAMVYGVEEE